MLSWIFFSHLLLFIDSFPLIWPPLIFYILLLILFFLPCNPKSEQILSPMLSPFCSWAGLCLPQATQQKSNSARSFHPCLGKGAEALDHLCLFTSLKLSRVSELTSTSISTEGTALMHSKSPNWCPRTSPARHCRNVKCLLAPRILPSASL